MTENLDASQAINEATKLPVICDCDTGYGNASNVMHMVKKYEAAGFAAVVIEDKRFPKVNSFVPGRQELAPMEEFMGKIEAAKIAQRNPDFMVFARIEALIAGWGIDEALRRAFGYAEAGADGIVIHSKAATPVEVFTFAQKWNGSIPLVVIPTTYYHVTADELVKRGFRMVIYANHGLRASISAMDEAFKSIYLTGSTAAIEGRIAPLKEVFEIQGMVDMEEDEKKFLKRESLQAIIPAARDHSMQPDFSELLEDRPLCMLEIGGKTLIDRQLDLLRSAGVTELYIVGGYLHEKIKADGARILYNPDYATRHSAHSVMFAKDHFKGKSVIVYSDILFDRQIVDWLVQSPHQATLVIDRAYQTLPFREKKLDLVVVEDPGKGLTSRRLDLNTFKPIRRIGKQIDKKEANYEFIGVSFFREEALNELSRAWEEALVKFKGRPFYGASNVDQASFCDLVQYLLDRDYPVYGMEIEHGWSEIHSLDDYERLNAYFGEPLKVHNP
jgi:phosphoenolpyruvate phosphomutase